MKKLFLTLTIVFCITLLAACSEAGALNTPVMDENTATPAEPLDMGEIPGSAITIPNKSDFLLPEYDYNENKLNMNDLFTGMVESSYSFETAQTPMLVQKTNQGVAMLSSQGTSDLQNVDGIAIISEGNSMDMMYWLFDKELKLQKQYELTDEDLIDGLERYVFAFSPDGKEIIYAVGDSLFRYTFESQNLEQLVVDMGQTVYYDSISYSGSGKYLAFYGDLTDKDGTAYGAIDLENRRGKVFFANHFLATTLTVNGEYAAIANAVRPASMGGSSKTGSVLFVDLARLQGKQISVDSGEESGLASVSSNGRFVITCEGGDSPSGVLRAYQVSDGAKIAEQVYTMDVNCKPCSILTLDQAAYAVLITDSGNLLSPEIMLH